VGDFAANYLIDLVLKVFRSHADGAGDGSLPGGGMCLHDRTVKAEHGSTPMDLGVQAAFDCPKRIAGQQRPDLAPHTGSKLPFEHPKNADRQTLAGLKHDVANEAIANDDIDAILKKVVTLDIADKIEVELLAKLVGFQRQFVALAGLGSDAEYAHTRVLNVKDLPAIGAAHDGELSEVNWAAFDVGAGIQQDKCTLRSGDQRGDGTTIHARNSAEFERRRSKNATRIAHGDYGIGFPFSDLFNGADDGTVALSADGSGWLLFHAEDLGRMDDLHAVIAKATLRQGSMDLFPVSDQEHFRDPPVCLESPFGAFDDNSTAVVATHDIHCNTHIGADWKS
jgi:hypothetical protein